MLRYSIGDVIDRLGIVLLKQWHLRENLERGGTPEEIVAWGEQIASLNRYRNECIGAINEALRDGAARDDRSA